MLILVANQIMCCCYLELNIDPSDPSFRVEFSSPKLKIWNVNFYFLNLNTQSWFRMRKIEPNVIYFVKYLWLMLKSMIDFWITLFSSELFRKPTIENQQGLMNFQSLWLTNFFLLKAETLEKFTLFSCFEKLKMWNFGHLKCLCSWHFARVVVPHTLASSASASKS